MKQIIYCICGYKNSGKTTLIEQIIPKLISLGFKVAVIKHDGHDFEGDIPNTDTYRHMKAGAYGTAIFSNSHVLIHKKQHTNEKELFKQFPEADIILIEGLKNSSYPKYICDYPSKIPNLQEIINEITNLHNL